MYSIDKQIARVKNADAITETAVDPLNPFDLVNASDYDSKGNLIRAAENPKDYDVIFAVRLSKIRPAYKCEEFLNHHFDNAPNKRLFLKHIEFHVLDCWKFGESSLRCIRNWIESKVGSMTQESVSVHEPGKKKGKYSELDCAVALHSLAIRLTTDGKGMDDNIDYAKLFGFNGRSLYNKLNAVAKGRAGSVKHETAAKTLIKEYNLRKVVTG